MRRCLKMTEKVSLYVYILSGQKFIKNVKKWSILANFRSNSVTSFNGTQKLA